MARRRKDRFFLMISTGPPTGLDQFDRTAICPARIKSSHDIQHLHLVHELWHTCCNSPSRQAGEAIFSRRVRQAPSPTENQKRIKMGSRV